MANNKSVRTRTGKTVMLVETAMLTAIVVVMSFTPLGYLRIGGLELTLIMVPVIIGAVTQGPAVAAFLGGIFGLTSFAQCFMGSALGTILVSISIPRAFVVCVIPRILAGLFCGLLFSACRKRDPRGTWSFAVAGISGSLFNTAFFLGLLALLFWIVQFSAEKAALRTHKKRKDAMSFLFSMQFGNSKAGASIECTVQTISVLRRER